MYRYMSIYQTYKIARIVFEYTYNLIRFLYLYVLDYDIITNNRTNITVIKIICTLQVV